MKTDLIEIIKTLINQDYDEKDIAIAILNLKDKWPNLTETEKLEIESVAYSIYSLGYTLDSDEIFPDCLYVDNDYQNEDSLEDESENMTYLSSQSPTYSYKNNSFENGEKGLKNFFKQFKRNN